MDKVTKQLVSSQIEVFLIKYPTASPAQIKSFILTGSQGECDLKDVSSNTLFKFIIYQRNKFMNTGSCVQRITGSGRPPSISGDKQTVKKILKSFQNEATPGLRVVCFQLCIRESFNKNKN